MIVERDESSGARAEERREHLKRLGDALTGHDFETELGSSGSGVPLLAVTNPDRPGLLCDTVVCCASTEPCVSPGRAPGSAPSMTFRTPSRRSGAPSEAPMCEGDGARRMTLCWVFASDLAHVAAARAAVKAALPRGCGRRDDIEVAVGELAANSARHARGETFAVGLRLGASLITVAVHDEGADTTPIVHDPPDPLAAFGDADPEDVEHGRGLRLVEACSDDWGYVADENGCATWARFHRPSSPSSPDPAPEPRLVRSTQERSSTPADSRDGTHGMLSLLASGCSDPKAACELGVSERTLRRRVNSAMNALGTRTRFQLGVAAARAGLVGEDATEPVEGT